MPEPLPIACSLDGTDGAARQRRWQTLADAAMLSAEWIDGGARQRYRDAPDVGEELSELVEAEAHCCPFLAFDLRRGEADLVLTIAGPPEAAGILALFAEAAPAGG